MAWVQGGYYIGIFFKVTVINPDICL